MVNDSFCPYCGATMDSEASFCPSCGAQIQKSEAPAGGPSTAYSQSAGAPSGSPSQPLKTIGIISLILAILGILAALCTLPVAGMIDQVWNDIVAENPDLFADFTADSMKSLMIIIGVTSLLLGIAGIVGSICCLKAKNYMLGLVMFIIALVINVVSMIVTLDITQILGIIIAVLLLVFYIKNKNAFSS